MNHPKRRYSIHNGNGSYRIPLKRGMDIRIEFNSDTTSCLFGDLADLVGRVENLGTIEELEEHLKKHPLK